MRNSLAYFPIAIANLSNSPNISPETVIRLDSLLQDILLFNLSVTEERVTQIEQDIQRLSELPNADDTDIANALIHANIILEKRLETDELIETALAIPTRQQGTTLVETYDMAYQHAVRGANFYRFGLYLLLTGLVIAVAVSIRLNRKLTKLGIIREQISRLEDVR